MIVGRFELEAVWGLPVLASVSPFVQQEGLSGCDFWLQPSSFQISGRVNSAGWRKMEETTIKGGPAAKEITSGICVGS